MTRRVAVLGGLLSAVAVAAFYWASAHTADAACTADPPGVTMPDHASRSLQLHVDGWDCVLADDGAQVAAVQLGWWPDDPAGVWVQLEGSSTTGLSGDEEGSWSVDPFPVSGWLVELIGPPACVGTGGEAECQTTSERLASPPCVQRFVHDYPDWTVEGCGRESSFIDGVSRYVVGAGPEREVYEEDHGEEILGPNPWFSPVFDDWQGRIVPVGTLVLHARELTYGGADVIGVDGDGVPVLYVQRNQSYLEKVSVFVRESGEFPTAGEVAAALELSGLPDQQLAEALVSDSRRQAAARQFSR